MAVQINVEVNFKLDGVDPVVPLHAPREASNNPPQFPGADLATYPLIFFIGHIKPEPSGRHYEIAANASLGGEAGLETRAH